jgi:hypothetical protein
VSAIDPTQPLSPSELVLFNGEKFAKKVMLGNIKLMHIDASVSNAQLGKAIITAAVLAAESAGNIKLEVRQEKALFGLRKVKNLYANPTPHQSEWPQFSLEAQLPDNLNGPNSVLRHNFRISRKISRMTMTTKYQI